MGSHRSSFANSSVEVKNVFKFTWHPCPDCLEASNLQTRGEKGKSQVEAGGSGERDSFSALGFVLEFSHSGGTCPGGWMKWRHLLARGRTCIYSMPSRAALWCLFTLPGDLARWRGSEEQRTTLEINRRCLAAVNSSFRWRSVCLTSCTSCLIII